MKLKIFEGKVDTNVIGTQAILVKNDVIGATLLLQTGQNQLTLKLSDLLEFVAKQSSEDESPNEVK